MSKRILTIMTVALLVFTACGSDDTVVTTPDDSDTSLLAAPFEFTGDTVSTYVANAGDFAGKSAADWDNAETVRIELDEMSFGPNHLTFEAGQPYKVQLVNIGEVKHEYTAGDFFASVAWRKAESAESEIKAPFFTEIEVFAGQTVELFFVPILVGTFDLVCEIEGHLEAGMHGSITVTGTTPTDPAPVLTEISAGPWVTNGSDLVSAADWDAMETIEIDMGEFYFAPTELHLTVGLPYKLVFVNSGDVKHEATLPGMFQTIALRKAQDASGEFKAPTLTEVETFAAQETELYFIPQETGTYDIVCEIEGHYEAGMFGTFVVDPA